MPLIPPSTEYAHRSEGPRSALTNMYAEESQQGPRSVTLRGRPGLVSVAELGEGPIWFVEYAGADRYVLSGRELYRNSTLIGTVSKGGTRQAAKSEAQFVFTSGGKAYVVDYLDTPGTVAQITDADLPSVSGVLFANGRFFYPTEGSGEYHWSAIADAKVIEGLSFATAEADPDAITRGMILGDSVLWFGSNSIESHRPTASPAAPLVRNSGLTQMKGCESPYSIALADNSLFFIGRDEGGRSVYRTDGGIPLKVSTATIDARLEEAGTVDLAAATAFAYVAEGHTWYVVSVPNTGCFAYDIATKRWAEWETYDDATFRVRTGQAGVYGGQDGKLYQFDKDAFTDDGDPLVRLCSVHAPIDVAVRCNVLSLECATGVGLSTGHGSDPVVEMRYTDDVTGDYTDWEAGDLGVQGDRATRVSWWQLGLMHPPERHAEFRCSDPVPFVVYGVTVNQRP